MASRHFNRQPSSLLDERRGTAKEVAPGAAEVLKHRLALPVREVADLLGISSAAVRLMIARGEIPGRKIGGGTERVTYIVPTGALLSWLEGPQAAMAKGVVA
jgi:excisionase family DNA binding protein